VIGPGTVVAGTHPDGQLEPLTVPTTLPEIEGTGQQGSQTGLYTVALVGAHPLEQTMRYVVTGLR
jgi:hypothetical protein